MARKPSHPFPATCGTAASRTFAELLRGSFGYQSLHVHLQKAHVAVNGKVAKERQASSQLWRKFYGLDLKYLGGRGITGVTSQNPKFEPTMVASFGKLCLVFGWCVKVASEPELVAKN